MAKPIPNTISSSLKEQHAYLDMFRAEIDVDSRISYMSDLAAKKAAKKATIKAEKMLNAHIEKIAQSLMRRGLGIDEIYEVTGIPEAKLNTMKRRIDSAE